jgi:NitT/TauT family transport system permease protein
LVGFLFGALLHALPWARRTIDPLLATYYSVPVFVFYPLFIVLFGLNVVPKTVIGFLYAVVAMVINTLNGLDRVPTVLWKTARVHRMGKPSTLIHMVFPYAAAYLFTGVKLAVAYSFIGVIGSEFILSSGGIGYRISFAYYNFQNEVMYALILLVLAIVVTINMSLYYWERSLMERRGGR